MANDSRVWLHKLTIALFTVAATLVIARGTLAVAALTPVADHLTLTACFFVFWAAVVGNTAGWVAVVWSVAQYATLYDYEREYRWVAGLEPRTIS